MGSKKQHEMIKGPEAFNRFRDALKTILAVPKSNLPQEPAFSEAKAKLVQTIPLLPQIMRSLRTLK